MPSLRMVGKNAFKRKGALPETRLVRTATRRTHCSPSLSPSAPSVPNCTSCPDRLYPKRTLPQSRSSLPTKLLSLTGPFAPVRTRNAAFSRPLMLFYSLLSNFSSQTICDSFVNQAIERNCATNNNNHSAPHNLPL